MRRTARFHHDVRSAVVLEVTLQLTATETFAIHNLARLIGNSELEDVLCKVNRDSACVHGWSSLVCSSPRRHEHARCRRGRGQLTIPSNPSNWPTHRCCTSPKLLVSVSFNHETGAIN